MTSLDKLKKQYEAAQKERTVLEKELEKLQAKQAQAEDRAQAQAEAGDVAAYMREKEAAEKIAAAAYVKSLQLAKTERPVSNEDAQAFWAEYSKDAYKTLRDKWNEYEKARKDLFVKFRDYFGSLEQALFTREQLSTFTGGAPRDAAGHFGLDDLPNDNLVYDREFLSRRGFLDRESNFHIGALLSGRTQYY